MKLHKSFFSLNVFFRALGAFWILILMQSCYTAFTHPQVSYVDKLGYTGDSLELAQLQNIHTEVRFDDDCKRCHSDFSVNRYYAPNSLYSSRSSAGGEVTDESPWWRKTGYYDMTETEAVEETVRRSKRSYNRTSTSGGGSSAEYIAPPGVLPGSGNVGSSGGTAGVSAKESEAVPLPVRQKESDKAATSKSGNPPAVDQQDDKSSTRRRR